MISKNVHSISDPEIQTFPAIIMLNSFLKMILKKWWLFIIVMLFAGIGGIFYASIHKIEYKSRLTFALDDQGSSAGGFMNIASQLGLSIDGGKDIFTGDNIIEIMKSRRMIEKVLLSVDTFNNKPYTFIEYYLKESAKPKRYAEMKIHFPVGQLKSTLSYQQDSLLYETYKIFLNNIVAQKVDRKLSIYEVSVTNPDEKFTKDFTDKIVAETNNFYIEIRTKKAKETLVILEKRVAAMKGNLSSSIADKATIQDINTNPAFTEAQVPVQKQQANIQVYGAVYEEMFKNLEVARLQYLNQIPLMQIIDAADYPMQKIKISKLKTGITWILISGLIVVFIFWILWIINYNKETELKDTSRLE
ncbi:MAG TPA: Wzz/FepE/Etk N-terminal domain-containing protein [Nitrososphaeraceae archaeon]|nr:Wzz/FepE/Etk N-terminal domain-containing protein [Nitrososphaeraceae archaeon]